MCATFIANKVGRRRVPAQALTVCVLLVSVAVSMAIPAPARAETKLRLITQAALGAAGTERDPQQRRGSFSEFSRLEVGLSLTHDGPRTAHDLLYEIAGTSYVRSQSGNFVNQELFAQSEFTLTKRLYLQVSLNGSQGLASELAPISGLSFTEGNDSFLDPGFAPQEWRGDLDPVVGLESNVGAFGPVPDGNLGYLAGGGSASLGVELAPNWYLSQAVGGEVFSSTVGTHIMPPIRGSGADIGLERMGRIHSGRVEVGVGYIYQPELEFTDELLPPQEGQVGRLSFGWGRVLGPSLQLALSAGAYAARVGLDRDFSHGPLARATMRFRGQLFRIALTMDHGAHPSLALGGIFRTDRAFLRGGGRFGQDGRYRFASAFRVSRLSVLEAEEGAEGPVVRWQAQALFSGRPWPRRHFELGVSYRFTKQMGALLGPRFIPDLERNMVMVSATLGWPTTPPE